MEKILVTGGAGFIGSHLVETLLSENYSVVCIDNFDDFYDPKIKRKNIAGHLKNSNYRLIEGDIRNFDLLHDLFEENEFDKVVHLAARAGVRPSIQQPLLYEDVNIKGTLNLLECAREFPVKGFIFGSSSSVYGVNKKVPFSEEDKIAVTISPYATTKRSNELFCYTYHHLYDIPITCLRFFTVYGPRQRPEMAIHKFTRLIHNDEDVTLFGDGKSKRDYTYIDDIIAGVFAAIQHPMGFEIINLGESQVVELRYLVSLIEENLDKAANIKWLPMQPGDVPITYADVSKAKRLLDYSPSVSIEEGVKRFVEWYLKN